MNTLSDLLAERLRKADKLANQVSGDDEPLAGTKFALEDYRTAREAHEKAQEEAKRGEEFVAHTHSQAGYTNEEIEAARKRFERELTEAREGQNAEMQLRPEGLVGVDERKVEKLDMSGKGSSTEQGSRVGDGTEGSVTSATAGDLPRSETAQMTPKSEELLGEAMARLPEHDTYPCMSASGYPCGCRSPVLRKEIAKFLGDRMVTLKSDLTGLVGKKVFVYGQQNSGAIYADPWELMEAVTAWQADEISGGKLRELMQDWRDGRPLVLPPVRESVYCECDHAAECHEATRRERCSFDVNGGECGCVEWRPASWIPCPAKCHNGWGPNGKQPDGSEGPTKCERCDGKGRVRENPHD